MASQKDIVWKVITEMLETTEFDARPILTSAQKTTAYQLVSALLISENALSEKAASKWPTVSELIKHYVPGLVNNHLRKDVRFNQGIPYKADKPGSRPSDKELKNLKLLLEQAKAAQMTEENILAIEDAIEDRKELLAAQKTKAAVIDLTMINPELLKKLNIK